MTRLYADDIGLITHFAPNRRQRQVRRRWLVLGLGLGALSLVLLAGQLNLHSASNVQLRTASPAVLAGR